MRNRAVTLLALLDANDRLGQPEVYRTVLMKQAFLVETLRPLYRQWRRMFKFVRYFYGPYSEDVFHHLDILIFNGLVDVVLFDRTRRRRLEGRYKITAAGRRILEQLKATEISEMATDLVWGLQTLGVDQAGAIARLVYQEPEFARIFAEHTKAGIPAATKVPLPTVTEANNETLTILAVLEELIQMRSERRSEGEEFVLSTREVVRIFLECLAVRAPRRRQIARAI